ncbi:aspartate aminotransferase family protein [Clostridium sp. D2Q-11]|uniref:Aspartate aminotransferase family protein n=1 Tax=Anaeromonas frigoriresistens TaxID=2683708 RepID=A0A942V3E5_9FIRM|nr:aspartate aminotransferase family protein [Anaeromonas frigoriresistens]MBS4539222.1 aspartate aminotransferase family protein [Anaeromonas frigoriresistens]
MDDLLLRDKKYILNLYNRIDLEIAYGKGSYLYDKDGNKYLDMFSGLSVNSFGHNNKEIIKTITDQATKYIHLSNYFASEPTVRLAESLINRTKFDKVFFSNSGTESIEGAIKFSRKFGLSQDKNKYKILSAQNSFHGRTFGALSLTGQEKFHRNFEPILPGFDYFNFNDIEDLQNKCDDSVCAIFLEFIQGEGGVRLLSDEFIENLINLSEKYNFLIVADEIQAGLGRTGKFLSYEHYNVDPDLVCISKSLGGGLPLGAILVDKTLSDLLQPGDHGSTFGGNPVSCASGYLTLKTLDDKLLKDVEKKGKYLLKELELIKNSYPNIISEIRGRGLMIGIECGEYANEIKKLALEQNLLLNVTNKTVIRLLPPLNITPDDLDIFLNTFKSIFSKIS